MIRAEFNDDTRIELEFSEWRDIREETVILVHSIIKTLTEALELDKGAIL